MRNRLDAIGLVVGDLRRSIDFYRAVGLELPDPVEGEDHYEVALEGGLRLMWDKLELVKQFMPDWVEPVGHRMGLAFHCGSPAGVDATHARVVAAGFASKSEPWDAFWGQRYAQVVDPDGNVVDLFASLG